MDVAGDADYILGHDDVERRRLNTQALFMEPLTRRGLLAAGLRPGMRVLDVGAGFGDVTLLAASLVGSTGSVVGIEREDSAVAAATARAAAVGATNVRFVAGDIRDTLFDERFDAVVGRFVLMYLADPAEALEAAVGAVHHGGLVVFQEWHAIDPFIVDADRRVVGPHGRLAGVDVRRSRHEPDHGSRAASLLRSSRPVRTPPAS